MKARLFCPTGELKGASFEIVGAATIGRDAGNDIRLAADQISNRHARIWFDESHGSFFVEDLESRNGTELDGAPVTGAERLDDLHVIAFAGNEFVFQRLAARSAEGVSESTSIQGEIPTLPISLEEVGEAVAAETAVKDATRIERQPVVAPTELVAGAESGPAEPAGRDQTRIERRPIVAPAELVGGAPAERPDAAAPASDQPKTLYLELTNRGEPPPRFALAAGENLLGRSSRAAISINTPELSRRHAVLTLEGDRIWIEDKGSRNRTYCGGERVQERVEVPSGAELRFANVEARIVAE
jgi:pSer/pThr/pTyr-binding forkhead associated (FHA) protein